MAEFNPALACRGPSNCSFQENSTMFDLSHDTENSEIERFLSVFRLAARQAGSVARHLQGEVTVHEKEGATTPESAALSAADLATQDVILLLMREAFADLAADAEEETTARALFSPEASGRPLLVVDPIDGSYNYLRGSRDYAVMGGWLREGRFRAALVHFPAWKRTFWGQGDQAWQQEGDADPTVARLDGPEDHILVTPRLSAERVARLRGAGFTVAVSRCSAVDATAPINGLAAAAVATGPTSRRRPSALYVTLCAGATVFLGGRPWQGEDPVDLVGRDEPIVCATTAELAGRIQALVE